MRKCFKYGIFVLPLMLLLVACKEEGASKHGYRVNHIIKNKGPKPVTDQWVYFHIEHKAGDEILSSSRNGINIPKMQMIPNDGKVPNLTPILDAFEMMTIGDSLEIHVPNRTFPRPYDQIGLDEEITYNITLLDILSPEDYEAKRTSDLEEMRKKADELKKRETSARQWTEQTLRQYKENRLNDIQKTSSGIEYVYINKGSGIKTIPNKRVEVNYYGIKKSDGEMFDNSFRRARTYSFVLGNDNVIRGWHEGVAELRQGDMAVLFIPSDLAYGAGGNPQANIDGNEDLVFLIEVVKVYR